MSNIVEDFESGSLSNEFTVRDSDFGVVSTEAFAGSNSAGIDETQTQTDDANVATFVPDEIKGGAKPDSVQFYWLEKSDSYGAALRVRDSSGKTITTFASDQPQWEVQDSDGSFREIYPGDGSDRWIRVKISFDYANDQVTFEIEDQKSKTQRTETNTAVNALNDVEKFDFMNYLQGQFRTDSSFGNGTNNMVMYYDEISFQGLESAAISKPSVSNIDTDGADFNAQVESQNNVTSADLGFDIFDSSSNLVDTVTAETNVDLTTKSLPYTFSSSTSSLSSDSSFTVEAFVDTSDNKFTSSTTSFQTDTLSSRIDQTNIQTFETLEDPIRDPISVTTNIIEIGQDEIKFSNAFQIEGTLSTQTNKIEGETKVNIINKRQISTNSEEAETTVTTTSTSSRQTNISEGETKVVKTSEAAYVTNKTESETKVVRLSPDSLQTNISEGEIDVVQVSADSLNTNQFGADSIITRTDDTATGQERVEIITTFDVQTVGTVNSQFKQIKKALFESIKSGDSKGISAGVVLDDGTVIDSDSAQTKREDKEVTAVYTVNAQDTSDSEEIDDLILETDDATEIWLGQINQDGGRSYTITVEFLAD